jgi:hypothetical protein
LWPLKRFLKILRNTLLILTGIIIVLIILVNFTPVQNFIAQKAVGYLSDKLDTKVTLKRVQIGLFNSATLEGLYIEDKHKDTLLYAGELQVKITDWFFLKDKPVVSYVGLRNAYANLYRKRNTDQWNYQFVIDAFASKETRPSQPKKESKLNLDLRDVVLQNVRFHMTDAWTGSDMIGELGDFEINARQLDFGKKIIDVKAIAGDKVLFGLRDYKGGRPPRPRSNAAPVIDTTPFNPGLWKVTVSKLKLQNSHFFLDDPDTKVGKADEFDATHMDITGIDLDVRDALIKGDTLTADLQLLRGKERCGLEIRKMKAKVKVSPNISECKELLLQTGNSVLTNYYAMHYERFPAFTDYLTQVEMVGNLEQSEVGMQDIVYFAPDLERFKNISVRISGKGRGTVERLRATNLALDDGLTQLRGDLYMNGLPDIESTFIDFQKGELRTNGAAAFLYVPELRQQEAIDLGALSEVVFNGSFTGFISDFVAYGTLRSNLGSARANINMKLPSNGQPQYSGALATDNFDAGRLFRLGFMEKISMDASIKGRGFDAATASVDVDGTVKAIMLNGYNYQNMKVNGTLAARKFDGKLSANDPNLALDFDGKIDFSGEEPSFDLYAKVGHANVKALKVTDDNITGDAEMKLDFSGSNIDNFIGSAFIYNMNIVRDSVRLNIDSLQLVSTLSKGYKQLTLTTNELSAKVSGQFSVMDLAGSARMFLSYYLPEYVARPAQVNEHQNLRFEITAGNTNDIISLFNKSLSVGEGASLSGTMDMAHQQLLFEGTLPSIQYGSFLFNNIQINSKGNYSGFSLEAVANGIKAGATDIASSLRFQTSIFQDSARFQLVTTTPTSIGSAQLNGMAYAASDSFYLHILPSEFYLNQTRWEIPAGNEIVFAKNYLALENLNIQSGLQKIRINTEGNVKHGDAAVQISNFDIAPLNTLLGMEGLNLDGRVNGDVHVSSLLQDQMIDFDVKAKDLRINTDTLGEMRATGSYDVAKSLMTLHKGSGLSYKNSRALLTGTYSFDPNSQENIDGEIELDEADVNWAQPFLAGYVRNLSGHINGQISIKGNASDPLTTGAIQLEEVGFTPDITGAHYTIKDAEIKVSDTKFDLGSIRVTDDEGREGILGGNIQHNRLSKMNFRLNMRSDNIKVVDLKDYQNPNFYGDVKASVQLRLSGPVNNLNLNIFATPQKNSHLFIPIGYGSDISEYDYIRFKQYGEMPVTKTESKNKLNIRIDAIATPDLEATIILDPATGDQIWAKGSGNIILEIPPVGEMKMNGNYIIDEGKYNFSFKQLQVLNYKRQFTINSNSVIKWNGDIADADLDVKAYAQIKARLYDLIINEVDRVGLSQSEIRDAQIMQMVNVQMNMRGSLKEPEFGFRLDLAENRSVGTYAYQKLQRINSDDKELLNQVASLLLLEQFVPPEGISNSNAVASGTINNMSELVSSAASSQITNFANKILGMEDLYIGLRYKNYNLADNSQPLNGISYLNRNEAGVNLRKNFFNNRLIIEVGGVYDWGRNNAQSDFTTNFAGDFRVQYLLTEDGRIRFNVFRTSNYDALFSQLIGRQGLGLSYRKSFNGLLDLFRSEEKMRREREQQLKQQGQQSLRKEEHTDTTGRSITQAVGK